MALANGKRSGKRMGVTHFALAGKCYGMMLCIGRLVEYGGVVASDRFFAQSYVQIQEDCREADIVPLLKKGSKDKPGNHRADFSGGKCIGMEFQGQNLPAFEWAWTN